MGGDPHLKCPTWARKDKMAKNNQTIDRIQAIWNMIGGDDVVDKLLAGTARLSISDYGYMNPVTLNGEYRFFNEFFKNSDHIFINKSFKQLVLNVATKSPMVAGPIKVGYCVLKEDSHDSEVLDILPVRYFFRDINEFLLRLASFIENYSNDSEFTDGESPNVFYVTVKEEIISVYLVYRSKGQQWALYANKVDAENQSIWPKGSRVFSRTIS